MEVALPPNPGVSEQFKHKNRLQEYTQRSALPLPVYQTVNEGLPHAPHFRSTVIVDGLTFRSSQTFANRKEAEQNVAKIALEGISRKIKDEGCPLIRADTMFCKSILYEYAVKMNLDKPTYTCSQSEGLLPMFISSVLLDGNVYKGAAGRTKKQAEQLSARAAIESILGNPNSSTRTLMSQIIKSKGKLYAAVHQVRVSNISMGMDDSGEGNIENLFGNNLHDDKGVQVALVNETSPVPVNIVACASGQLSEEKQLKRGCIGEPVSALVESETTPQHVSQAGPPSQQILTSSQIVSDEHHLRLHGQGNETSAVGPSGFSSEAQEMPSDHKKKRLKTGKGKR